MSLDPEEIQSRGPVVRDKRRIDPVTGEVRERPEGAAHSPAHREEEHPDVDAQTLSVETELAERTADLQRLQAEFLNYKRRVDRDRENAHRNAVASTLASLLPVLDDISRAREHGELTGGFKAVAESFERTVEKLGLVPFGEVGDEFDPRIHDALTHSYSDAVTGPTCLAIVQVGYRIDDRVLRPAMVAVAEPTAALDTEADAEADAEADVEPEAAGHGEASGDDRRADPPPYQNES